MLVPIHVLVVPALVLLLICRVLPVKPWIARKIVHIGIGSLLMAADPQSQGFALCVFASGAVAVVMVGLPRTSSILGPYAKLRDVGILGYSATVCFCVAAGVPLREIAPLFYADPAGAIVGRLASEYRGKSKDVRNPQLFGTEKTLFGTISVAVVASISTFLGQEQSLAARMMVGLCVAAIELFGGKLDNPCIGIFLVLTAMLR